MRGPRDAAAERHIDGQARAAPDGFTAFPCLRLDLDGLGESLKQFDASQGRDPAALRLV